jgi:RNA polymerase sigma factor (sigma-70 family)
MKTHTQHPDGLVSNNQRNSKKVVSNNQRNLNVSDAQRNFEQFIQSNRNKLYGMVYNMVHNHQDTEDLLQDSLAKAHKALSSYDGRASLSTWIHTITYNTTINHIRGKRNKWTVSINDEDSGLKHNHVFLEKTIGVGVDKEYMGKELMEEIYKAIDTLPLSQQVVVKWFDIEGYSHKRIAQMLGINENTVRSRLFYAHKRLQVLLAEYKELI